MLEPQDPQLADNPLYVRRAERANADKPPARSTPIGAVAQVRAPGVSSRRAMMDDIRAQDELVAGHFGTVYYKPVDVCGIDLKLEPVQPSIGTIVHGLDLAKDLDDPEMVAFLRNLWLERKVLVFRGQAHLSRHQMVAFAERFGEVGAPFGEREHVPNSPHDLNQQVKAPGIPDMLILPSDETVPNAASGWHADATWQQRPPMGSMLICREAPPVGGDTCFCDCYGMWEGLPLETKERVRHLKAVHIGTVGHQMDGKTPVAVHPVARTHPETGGTTLYVQQGFVRRSRRGSRHPGGRGTGAAAADEAPRRPARVHLPRPVGGRLVGHVGQPLRAAQRQRRLLAAPAAHGTPDDSRLRRVTQNAVLRTGRLKSAIGPRAGSGPQRRLEVVYQSRWLCGGSRFH